jgi:hypothetical protein
MRRLGRAHLNEVLVFVPKELFRSRLTGVGWTIPGGRALLSAHATAILNDIRSTVPDRIWTIALCVERATPVKADQPTVRHLAIIHPWHAARLVGQQRLDDPVFPVRQLIPSPRHMPSIPKGACITTSLTAQPDL